MDPNQVPSPGARKVWENSTYFDIQTTGWKAWALNEARNAIANVTLIPFQPIVVFPKFQGLPSSLTIPPLGVIGVTPCDALLVFSWFSHHEIPPYLEADLNLGMNAY